MLFNSLAFLLFFPVVTGLYFALPHRWRAPLLLAASCVFYMAFVPAYIAILAFTIVVDYVAGIAIERAAGRARRWALGASIVANVGVLAVFKYYGFLATNLTSLGHALGLAPVFPALRMLLPIGLSFHTFQAMSYTIEVYRGAQRAERSLLTYALYVMFYPQLVAGPIERPQNLLHQFREPHRFEYARVRDGLLRMAVGMFKKVVLADTLAAQVNRVYEHPHAFGGPPLVVATVFFAFQIYWDFAGYSDIAIGSAQVMGFRLMENFRTPYFARSVGEFWRRWHVSLSTWFKDYVYIPLGGSRTTTARHYANLLTVFAVSGLWHGASWTYVVWGLLHGTYLVVGDATRPLRSAALRRLGLDRDRGVVRVGATLTTFVLVTIAWVFFRATTFEQAWYVLSHAFGPSAGADRAMWRAWTACAVMIAGAVAAERALARAGESAGSGESAEGVPAAAGVQRLPAVLRYAVYYGLVYGCVLAARTDAPQFIYFQF